MLCIFTCGFQKNLNLFLPVQGLCCGLSLVVASRGCSSLWCPVFSLQSTDYACGLSSYGSQALENGLSNCGSWAFFEVYGIFADQGSNLCLPHWQADSLPLSHEGSPYKNFLTKRVITGNWNIHLGTGMSFVGRKPKITIYSYQISLLQSNDSDLIFGNTPFKLIIWLKKSQHFSLSTVLLNMNYQDEVILL